MLNINPLALFGYLERKEDDCTSCVNWDTCPLPIAGMLMMAEYGETEQTIEGLPVLDFDKMLEKLEEGEDEIGKDVRLGAFLRRMIAGGKNEMKELYSLLLEAKRLN